MIIFLPGLNVICDPSVIAIGPFSSSCTIMMMEVDTTPTGDQPLSVDNNKEGSMGCSSKSKCIRGLLLEAWKNRWSEVEWSMNMKKVLPRGVSADIYDLADGILQQSLVGAAPNQLMLSYLTHSLNAGIISFGAVIGAIASYNDLGKQECISALLDLLLSFKSKITASSVTGLGNEEECMKLAVSLVSICSWCFSFLRQASSSITDSRKRQVTQSGHQPIPPSAESRIVITNVEKVTKFLYYFSGSSFLVSLFNVGKNDDIAAYQSLKKAFREFADIEKKTGVIGSSLETPALLDKVIHFMDLADWTRDTPANLVYDQIASGHFFGKNSCSSGPSSAFSSLNTIIAFSAVLNPVSDIESVACSLLKVARFNNQPLSDLVMETIRSCFIGLVDSGTSCAGEELKWAAFTFLKMPHILNIIVRMTKSSQDVVEEALERLLTFSPLLDKADCKSNCDCLSLLMDQLKKVDLVSDDKLRELKTRRQIDATKSSLLGKMDSTSSQQPQSSLILKAEPTVTSILASLDGDYSKNQDSLFAILCHMPGKSFELIMTAAAATGKLRNFTMKLLKFNEFNKHATGESDKAAQTRALLFDVTFLMLCQISQNYGSEVITSIPETQSSFFATWCAQCLPQAGNYRCPDLILGSCDLSQVDALLTHFTGEECEFKTTSVKWHEYCINLPAVVKEVLLAWEQDAVNEDFVTQTLNNVKRSMCCLPVVVSAWLTSLISVIHSNRREKAIKMLVQFATPFSPASTSESAVQSESESIFFKERSNRMCSIIKKMMSDLMPQPDNVKSNITSHILTSKTALADMMESTFNGIHSRSWQDTKSTHEIQTLLDVGGTTWFVEVLVRQLLKRDHGGDLNRAVGLIFGLMHVNLGDCSMVLVSQVLPSYLMSQAKQEMLFEPKASALARLSVLTIFAALDIKRTKSLKRDQNLEQQLVNTPYLLQRSMSSDEISVDDDLLQDPFMKAVANLMLLLSSVAADPDVSQRTVFPIVFQEQAIMCARHECREVLQFLPLDMAMSLMRTSPENLSYELLVTLGDMETAKGRKTLARTLCQLSRVQRMVHA